MVEKWLSSHPDASQFVKTKEELMSVDVQATDYLFGTFGPSHTPYAHEKDPTYDPSLAEMTEKAVEILRKNENGFFLMVEEGLIDYAHHDTMANKAMSEAAALDETIEHFMTLMGEEMEDTLMVVTADHGHTMSFGGDVSRGSNIMGEIFCRNGKNLCLKDNIF